MPIASTTTDVFTAIAEPRRRQIIDLLAAGEPRAVGDLVLHLNLAQPAVSKHLSVLKKVGVVSVTRQGQHRLYQLEPQALRSVHDWVKTFERFWSHQIDRIKERAERKAAERSLQKKSEPKPQEK